MLRWLGGFLITKTATYNKSRSCYLIYFNFKLSSKFGWCRAGEFETTSVSHAIQLPNLLKNKAYVSVG